MLHVFHHSTTLLIAWASWRYPIGASWSGPLTNTLVHCFMYGYYAATEFGLPRTFGLLITPLQLAQFWFCLALATWDLVAVVLWGSEGCGSNVYTLGWNLFCYLVFLVLFRRMFQEKKEALTPRKKDQ